MRNIKFTANEYYHLYNRGVDKRIIFNNENDYFRFVILLYLCNSSLSVDLNELFKKRFDLFQIMQFNKGEELVHIGAYCLMPNHFHLLVFEIKEGGISLFMQKLQTAFTMYFNKKYERSGALFQGKFKAKHVQEDNYLMYLFAYIHLNPIKLIDSTWKEKGLKNIVQAKNYLKKYQYSSHLDFIGLKRPEKNILNLSKFPVYFNSEQSFENFIDWFDKNK